ncbi:MAG: hypothetical protein QXQ94_09315 [Candidatus Bathyarchaeia archaeon]
MPWGRTWSEELVAEWLELEGFLVTIGLKAGTGGRGGRKEADVVGARIRNSKFEIMHIEIGALYENSRKIVETVTEKFDLSRVDAIKKYFSQLGLGGQYVEYNKIYVMSYARKDKKEINEMLSPFSVKFWDIEDLIENIKQSIDRWIQVHRTPQNPYPSLPESHWLLKLFSILATKW